MKEMESVRCLKVEKDQVGQNEGRTDGEELKDELLRTLL
jgi:hypothetical protein